MCLYPRLTKNRKYTANIKNGGIIPPVPDPRVLYVPIGCGECIECRQQKARSWQIRLQEDIRHNKNGKFVTFTFSDESIAELIEDIPTMNRKGEELTGHEIDNAIATLAVRRFLERWRKEFKKSIRHWLVTELGHEGTENIHIHGIIWTDEPLSKVEKHWQYGFMWKGKLKNGKLENYVNEKTVNYIMKYVHKVDEHHKEFKSIILTSSGIGKAYMERTDKNKNKYIGSTTNTTYKTRTGHKMALPIYYRNKIYSEEEREKLWLHKLNEQKRYVCGDEIDISKGLKEYWNILEFHRWKNRELGYGAGKFDWQRKEYEDKQRDLMRRTRIQRAIFREMLAKGEECPF